MSDDPSQSSAGGVSKRASFGGGLSSHDLLSLDTDVRSAFSLLNDLRGQGLNRGLRSQPEKRFWIPFIKRRAGGGGPRVCCFL